MISRATGHAKCAVILVTPILGVHFLSQWCFIMCFIMPCTFDMSIISLLVLGAREVLANGKKHF